MKRISQVQDASSGIVPAEKVESRCDKAKEDLASARGDLVLDSGDSSLAALLVSFRQAPDSTPHRSDETAHPDLTVDPGWLRVLAPCGILILSVFCFGCASSTAEPGADSGSPLNATGHHLLGAAMGGKTQIEGEEETEEHRATQDDDEEEEGLAFRAPTLGGKQFWTDHVYLHGWRIQQHAWSKHYRLLDPDNRRETWGDLEKCERRLNEIAEERGIEPMKGHVVILLHGLGRTRSSMSDMGDVIRDEDDFEVIRMGYASTRAEVADHARALDSIIEHLPEVERISFVAHSLGNIVIRHYVADQLEENDGEVDERIHRLVMLAPPNQGSSLAERFRSNPLFHVVWGRSGKQLSRSWDELGEGLATPPFEFGIIAGGEGSRWTTNPLLDGDDDLIVTVEETKLAGASDFLVLRAAHTFLMDNDDVQEATLTFLREGFFKSERERHRLTHDEDE